MTANRRVFGLWDVFASVTCFAVASASLLILRKLNSTDEIEVATKQAIALIGIPIFGGAIGGGVGILFHRFWAGAKIGALSLALIFCACALFWPAIKSHT